MDLEGEVIHNLMSSIVLQKTFLLYLEHLLLLLVLIEMYFLLRNNDGSCY